MISKKEKVASTIKPLRDDHAESEGDMSTQRQTPGSLNFQTSPPTANVGLKYKPIPQIHVEDRLGHAFQDDDPNIKVNTDFKLEQLSGIFGISEINSSNVKVMKDLEKKESQQTLQPTIKDLIAKKRSKSASQYQSRKGIKAQGQQEADKACNENPDKDKKPEDKKDKQPPGTSIIDNLVEQDIKNYQIQRPFLRSQFHQCIPNPHPEKKAKGELVTVQMFSMWAFGFADPKLSVDEMKNISLDPAKQISTYKLANIEKKPDLYGFLEKNIMASIKKKGIDEKAEESKIKKTDDAGQLELSEIGQPMTKIQEEKQTKNDILQNKNQIAIIGFWKKDDADEFHCYHFFYVQNPLVREYARSERNIYNDSSGIASLSICQILFKGADDDLFLIFNPTKVEDQSLSPEEDAWRLGILNLEPTAKTGPFADHDYKSMSAFLDEFPLKTLAKEVSKEIENKRTDYKSKQNPTIFRRAKIQTSINKESNNEGEETKADQTEEQIVLVYPKESGLTMYTLGKDKATIFKKNLELGQIFLKYDQATDTVQYLADLPTKKQKIRKQKDEEKKKKSAPTGQILMQDIVKTQIYECLVCLKLNEEPDQKASDEDKTRLNFQGVECLFDDTRKGIIINAHIHNDDSRVTIIREGYLAITFEQTKVSGEQQFKIKYYIESQVCRGITMGRDLYIESDLKRIKNNFGKRKQHDDTCQMSLTLYKVSTSEVYDSSSSDESPEKEIDLDLEKPAFNRRASQLSTPLKSSFKKSLTAREKASQQKNVLIEEEPEEHIVEEVDSPKIKSQKQKKQQLPLKSSMISMRTIELNEDSPNKLKQLQEATETFHPNSQIKLEVLISQNLHQSMQSDGHFFTSMMPMSLQKIDKSLRKRKSVKRNFWHGQKEVDAPRLQLTGSAVFENVETGEVDLCIFRSLDQNCKEYYPEQVMRQSWICDYPILAYKSVSPDNKEIVLCHLAQEIPQRQIYLEHWEFVSFVHGNYEDSDIRKQIVLLVKNRVMGKMKLLNLFIDPWKNISFSEPFDVPENFFVAKTEIPQPKGYTDEPYNMFSSLNMKKVSFLPAKPFKQETLIVSLIVQYEHTILTLSVNSNSYRRLTDPGNMAFEYMISGYNDGIFFAEKELDRSSIHYILLHSKTLKVKNREIWQMGCKVVGMENDTSNDTVQQAVNTIFVLGEDQRLLRLQEVQTIQGKFECIGVFDFTGYDFGSLIENNWSQCHLSPGTITYDEFVFQANNEHQNDKKGQNCFYWPEAKHISQNATHWSLDSRRDVVVFERTKVQQLSSTTSMIAVGREPKRKKHYDCGTWFRIRPANSSREYSVIAEERRSKEQDVNYMAFCTNQHTLVQFRKMPEKDEQGRVSSIKKDKNCVELKTVIFDTRGVIVPQDEEVQSYLDGHIIGESEIKDGDKYFVTMQIKSEGPKGKETEKAQVILLRSKPEGFFDWKFIIEDYTRWIKNKLEHYFRQHQDKFKAENCDIDKLLEAQDEQIASARRKVEEQKTNFMKTKMRTALTKEENIRKTLSDCKDPNQRYKHLSKNIQFHARIHISRKKRLFQMVRVILPEHIDEVHVDKNDEKFKIHFHTIQIKDDWELVLVMVVSRQETIMKDITTRVVGEFFCYRHHTEAKIKCIKFQDLENENNECVIDLTNLITEKSVTKFITFDGLKKQSNLRYKETHFRDLLNKINEKNKEEPNDANEIQLSQEEEQELKASHWLNVSVQNSSYIFDLDKQIILAKNKENPAENSDKQNNPAEDPMFEISFLESSDQLNSLENFVDTGMSLTSVKNIKNEQSIHDKDQPIPNRILTNEQVSLYFSKGICKKPIAVKFPNKLGIKIKDYHREYEGNIHRTYSFIDLLNLVQIRFALKKGEEFFIRDQTMLSVYEGHTIFSIFVYNPQVFDQIHSQIKSRSFEDTLDEFKNVTEDSFLRRLYRIMIMPTIDNQDVNQKSQFSQQFWCKKCMLDKERTENFEDKKQETLEETNIQTEKDKEYEELECRCRGFYPLVMKSIHYESTKIRDVFIKILMHCDEFEITNMTKDIVDMQRLIKSYNPLLGKVFDEKCFLTNRFCKRTEDLDIQVSKQSQASKTRVVLSYLSVIDTKTIQDKLEQSSKAKKISLKEHMRCTKKEKKKMTIDVDMRMIRTDWLFRKQGLSENSNDFLQLIDTLDESDNQALYTTTFVEALLEPIYIQRSKVFYLIFLPFMAQSAACFIYFSFYLQHEEFEFSFTGLLLQLCIVLTTAYFVYQEILQLQDQGFTKYIWQLTNIIDWSSSTLNCVLVVNELFNHFILDHDTLKICTMFALAFVWYKVFYWMRLFKEPAFFMNLLTNTLGDIVPFMLMISILIMMFSNVIYILNLVDQSASDEQEALQRPVYAQIFSPDYVNAIMHMYILAVGDYDTDGFDGKGTTNKFFLWIIFIGATFMIQVTFMNMLIAIMSNTFDDVMEKKHQSAIEERIILLNDFRLFLDKFKLEIGAQYLFVIKPSGRNQLEESLENQVAQVKELTENQTKSVLKFQELQGQVFSSKFESIQAEMHQMNENIDKKVSHVMDMLNRFIENYNNNSATNNSQP